MKLLLTILLSLLFFTKLQAQFYLEPIVGFQVDLNNNGKYKGINSGVNFDWRVNRRFELLFQMQRTNPFIKKSNDSAFTTNPALPVYSPEAKKISINQLTFSVGVRLKIAGWKNKNSVYVLLNLGGGDGHVNVKYNYDKTNYTILNPDQPHQYAGLYFSHGLEYLHQLNNGARWFAQMHISALTQSRYDYPNSFNSYIPLTFNVGYSIPIKRSYFF